MKTTSLFAFLLMLIFFDASAQELNASVQILAPRVSNLNKAGIEELKGAIRNFLNNNKFDNEVYLPQERINCSFVITINSWDGGSGYTAEAQIQSSRPVFNTSYNTTLLNINDKNFDFSYNDGSAIDFSEQTYTSNLSALLTYYAYTIIGLDKDSFVELGGTSSFKKAQKIVNLAQVSGTAGWKASDGLRNRFWFNENVLNPIFLDLRKFIYTYHLKGLDALAEGTQGLNAINDALPDLEKLDKQKTGSIFPNVYFAGKADEIANVLSKLNLQQRVKAYNRLAEVDPANVGKYEVLKK
ncbi:hypothetical protein ABIB40_001333 [Pedobacter sp. UYP30]|uniref:type IX secretion system protein PorD n=1 Tax=Pedobacter sp. UYP30 TaxID=1756400 RepID=UPI0033963C07